MLCCSATDAEAAGGEERSEKSSLLVAKPGISVRAIDGLRPILMLFVFLDHYKQYLPAESPVGNSTVAPNLSAE
eukprot:12950-Prymnesium_polylepis.1